MKTWPLRNVTTLGALLGVLLAGVASAQETTKTGPRIRVEPASFDFGRALQNKTLEKAFTVKNYGDAELVLENVTTTCGCTVVEAGASALKPGASTSLRVTFETRTARGRVERSVLIKSNDAETPLLEVKLQATVQSAAAAAGATK
jgi:hypothetical protein